MVFSLSVILSVQHFLILLPHVSVSNGVSTPLVLMSTCPCPPSRPSFVVIPHIQPLSVILFKIPTLSCKVLLVMVSPPTKKACACASNISDLLLKQINSV